MFITLTTPRVSGDAGLGRKLRHAAALAGEIATAILVGPMRFYENRRLMETMAGMSDHELADIGLSRQDVADSQALSGTTEAGGFLATRAGERRRRRG